MIKKILVIILIYIIMLFSNSCVLRSTLFDDSGQKADIRLKQIIEAINNDDKDSLKSMFSEQALNESSDIDERINYLFDFINGEINNWETITHGSGTESIDHGKRTKNSCSWYYIDTDSEKYFIAFLEYLIDTENPEKIGLYMIYVVKAEDEGQFRGFGPDTRYAGIYTPEE